MPDKRLVVIDGYSLLFRAFYGTRYLSTSDGRPTNALFGFVNTLILLFGDLKPDAVVVALDAPGKTFRDAVYPEYKGTRQETPAELKSQLVTSREMIAALNIPVLEVVGFEADDVVGTISRKAEQMGYNTTIVTGDRDSLQLVDECITVMMPGIRGAEPKFYDPAAVQERFGFGPEHVVDYKSMAGDSSDNIPGVPGIGDKTATLLIQRYGSAEAIIENLPTIEEKFRKKIEPMVDQMLMSKKLATIECDVPLNYDFAPFVIDVDHLHQVRAMVESLEFKSQANRLEAALAPYMSDGAKDFVQMGPETIEATLVDGLASYDDLVKFTADKDYFSLVIGEEQAQLSMFDTDGKVAYVAVGSAVRKASYNDAVRLFLTDPARVLGHDLKPLYKTALGQSDKTPAFDTMLAAYVLQSERQNYTLDDLAGGYLDSRPRNPEQRAASVFHLQRVMREKIEAEGQTRVLDEIETPLIPVLAEMELAGICVNRDYLQDFSKSLDVSIEQSRQMVCEMAGQEFNIGSPKQLGEILFEKLAIPGGKKTKTGWATGAEILTEMDHPIAQQIVNYRELTKLKSTYADALPRMIRDDGRIHTTFNQTVAATGRLSSIDPNLQNIPVRTELGRQIRRAFEAAPGYQLASYDYSQIELRVLAHMSADPNLVEAFQNRVDAHTVTAAIMFKVEEADVTKDQRNLAKLLNYAVLYGVTDFGLANQLGAGFSRSEASELIKLYNERFPTVKAFTQGVVEEARAKGFTTTLCGRRRFFAEIHAANRGVRQYAERQAMNAPIQGTAADMIKLAMLKVRKELGQSRHRMLLQVHDELVFEVSGDFDDHRSLFDQVKLDMETALPMSVPIEVDGKIGPNWLEMTPVT